MTKKSKKKALKTGSRSAESPRVTTVCFSTNITQEDKYNPAKVVLDSNDEFEQNCLKSKISKGELKRLQKEKRLQLTASYEEENKNRHVYPTDVWFVIGRFISPEQVTTFCCICKDSYYVSTTKQFWMWLYKRYVTEHKTLPSHLKPDSIGTNVGLKARVLRAIFHVYKPLSEKMISSVLITNGAEKVENHKLDLFWWKQLVSCKRNMKVWMYYFKLIQHKHSLKKDNLFKLKNLIHYNPEKHYQMLRVTTPSFTNIPNVSGMHLTSVNITASRDFRQHKLKLTFHDYNSTGKYLTSLGTPVIIEPVFDIQILNWWHPDYPHPFDN